MLTLRQNIPKEYAFFAANNLKQISKVLRGFNINLKFTGHALRSIVSM